MSHARLAEETVLAQEAFLRRSPLLFRGCLVGIMLLGAALFTVLFGMSFALIAAIIAVVITSKATVLAAKLVKVIWVLLIPLWLCLRITWRALFSRQPLPEGRWIAESEAPRLFQTLAQMRKKMRGPKIDGVLLVSDMNAYAITRPWGGYWFIPKRQRFIAMGMPLVQTLSEREAIAIVAHEYGHLSGYPSCFDAFVYRARFRLMAWWQQINDLEDWPSRVLTMALRWYVACFDRWAFALCRASEYAADHISARLVGSQATGEALVRTEIAAIYLEDRFWTNIYRQVKHIDHPGKVRPWQQLPALVRAEYDPALSIDLLREAMRQETSTHDTHPALRDRLSALAFDPARGNARGVMHPVASQNAAEAWFDDKLAEILAGFEHEWSTRVSGWWREERQRLADDRVRQNILLGRSCLSDDEAWELLLLRIDNDEVKAPDAAVLMFIEKHPEHADSLLAWGRRHLGDRHKEALAAVHRAMRLNADSAHEGAEILERYYESIGDHERRAVYTKLLLRMQVEEEES